MYKLVVYVPESHLEAVKSALFSAGAGRMGDYDSCAWQVLGQGQFRPLEGSQPYLGQQGKVEYVPEYRVELVWAGECIYDALSALRRAPPYEARAYDVWRLMDL